MLIKLCKRCGNGYKTCYAQKDKRVCCSRSCSIKIRLDNGLRDILRKSRLGKTTSDKQKEIARINFTGKNNPNFGKDMSGSNNGRWIADRSMLAKRQERNDMAYKEWRSIVLKRDKECKLKDENCSGYRVVHHILGWTANPELRYDISNGITLCQFHHPRKRVDEQRLIPVFKELVGSNKY